MEGLSLSEGQNEILSEVFIYQRVLLEFLLLSIKISNTPGQLNTSYPAHDTTEPGASHYIYTLFL